MHSPGPRGCDPGHPGRPEICVSPRIPADMDAAGPRASLRAPCSRGLCRGPTGGSQAERGDGRALSVYRSLGPLGEACHILTIAFL